ncbi:hypothetical protein F8154_03245 [Alkaliphilus pronyensis]|uniref:Uncharacterized protein n=1 Tax=Alkaliphilus pronyensis TaxID=1482732 RepID=A0A6I0F491_9FIRM|nr:hypothetical protein [Alkaliphilus pronyensis]KAB3537320.1 hypothetical protein F8154_03245 [Alkaliphilus pronyensis]
MQISNKAFFKRPIIGLLIKENHKSRLIKKQKPLHKHIPLIKANESFNLLMYFFAMTDITIDKGYVLGIYYDDDSKTWLEKDFPLPDIIYKLFPSKKSYKTDVFLKVIKKLGIKSLNYINSFDKWQLYNDLIKY